MNNLLTPSARYLDSLKSSDHACGLPEGFDEVALTVSCEEFEKQCTWDDFRNTLTQSCVWMANEAVVCSLQRLEGCGNITQLTVNDIFGEETCVHVATMASSAGSVAGVATVTAAILMLIAPCVSTVRIASNTGLVSPLTLAANDLEGFLMTSRHLRSMTLGTVRLSADQMRALSCDCSVQIALEYCNLMQCMDALDAAFRQNRGPVTMNRCEVDVVLLAGALEGNSSLQHLTLRSSYGNTAKDCTVIKALAENMAANVGIQYLNLDNRVINNANWSILCQSLSQHAAMRELSLTKTVAPAERAHADSLKRTRIMADLAQTNTVLRTIKLDPAESNKALVRSLILPALEHNLYRERVQNVIKSAPGVRPALLGRSIFAATHSSNAIWMLLSQNMDVMAHSNISASHQKCPPR